MMNGHRRARWAAPAIGLTLLVGGCDSSGENAPALRVDHRVAPGRAPVPAEVDPGSGPFTRVWQANLRGRLDPMKTSLESASGQLLTISPRGVDANAARVRGRRLRRRRRPGRGQAAAP